MSFNYEVRLLGNLSKILDNESFHDLTIALNEGHGSVKANKAFFCSKLLILQASSITTVLRKRLKMLTSRFQLHSNP